MTTTNPASWNAQEVIEWAQTIDLPTNAIGAIQDNEIDGSVLLTLKKADLRDDLSIGSFVVRRFLWDAIEQLRSQYDHVNFGAALQMHQQEIEKVQNEPESHPVDPLVIQMMNLDVSEQRQVMSDRDYAMSFNPINHGVFQTYEDSQYATECQVAMDQMAIQEEYDHMCAQALSQQRRPARAPNPEAGRSLVSLCIDSCVRGRVNVAEALNNGTVRLIPRNPESAIFESESKFYDADDGYGDVIDSNDDVSVREDDDRKMPARTSLPLISCYSCLEDSIRGFPFACQHASCKSCLTRLLRASLRDVSLLPLTCCEIPIDMNVAKLCLPAQDASVIFNRIVELEATNKTYCPGCGVFINLDMVDASESTFLDCHKCGEEICCKCVAPSHRGVSCATYQNMTNTHDAEFEALFAEKGWRKCPRCSVVIELRAGCNHMTCMCSNEFCYQCLSPWNSTTGLCASGVCQRWEEENLLEGGEQRVQAEEQARGLMFAPVEREQRVAAAMDNLYHNEECTHRWTRRTLRGSCERCGFDLWSYGMVCQGTCNSTVCYTCAHHRIPRQGWR